MTTYSFTKIVASDRLTQEIQESSITIALDGINTSGSSVAIVFKADLSVAEQATLAAIVDAHVATSLQQVDLVTLDSPTALDGKPFMATTPRPIGTFTFVSSAGDDSSDQSKVNSGSLIEYAHVSGDGVGAHTPIYFDINAVINETHIHTGFLQWYGAKRDKMTVQIVPQVTSVTDGSNTFFNVVNGIVIAAAGNGTKVVNLATARLVEMVPNEHGTMPPGYWDATYNTTSKSFENITFNALGKGKYNIFAVEAVLNAFIPAFLMLGNGWFDMDSHDVTQMGHNMRIKVTPETRGDDHDWEMCMAIQLYRKKTA